jgi:Helix-turn-helix of DDE superfamily endonuclease
LLSYDRLSKKLLLFKSFTGLTVKEFDDIYKKEIAKRYERHEIRRLSKRKDREREIGAGRHFKLYHLAYVFKLYRKFFCVF